MFDLATLDYRAAASAGKDTEILHPVTKKGLRVFFTIIGTESDDYTNYTFDGADANVTAQVPGRPREIPSARELYEKEIADVAFCVRGWYSLEDIPAQGDEPAKTVRHDGVINIGGQTVTFGRGKPVIDVLTRFTWIQEQLQKDRRSRGFFIPASGNS